MEESEENMSSEDVKKVNSSLAVKIPKKRSLVERELETNMTARVTSPVVVEGLCTSRYGRPWRLKTEAELIEIQKALFASIKSPSNENTPVKITSPVYRMHASNSPQKAETPKKLYLKNQIDKIYQENISFSRFSEDTVPSPAKKVPKVYITKDLIQNREKEIVVSSDLFSPIKSASKLSNTIDDSSAHSTEKYDAKQNGPVDNSSIIKTLDFNSNKRKKVDKDQKDSLSKNELFELQAKCPYQVGDLVWARVGSFPFWPCIITRDPNSEMFVKKQLFGRVEHDIFHVTFFGDNGRRSWIVDNMLRQYQGLREFESTRDKFTLEDKKKDPRLYAAFFISEKKQPLWNMSVEEAETLLRESKRLRIDIFNDMLWKIRASKKTPKSGKISANNSGLNITANVDQKNNSNQDISTAITIDDDDDGNNPIKAIQSGNKPIIQSIVIDCAVDTFEVMQAKSVTEKVTDADLTLKVISTEDDLNESKDQENVESTASVANYTNAKLASISKSHENDTKDISSVDVTALASNDFNVETQSIQNTQVSETVDKVKKTL